MKPLIYCIVFFVGENNSRLLSAKPECLQNTTDRQKKKKKARTVLLPFQVRPRKTNGCFLLRQIAACEFHELCVSFCPADKVANMTNSLMRMPN